MHSTLRFVALLSPVALLAATSIQGCGTAEDPNTVHSQGGTLGVASEAATFLESYHTNTHHLFTTWQQSEWTANTKIGPRHEALVRAATDARREYLEYIGSAEVVDKVKRLLRGRDTMDPLEMRQLDRVLALAATYPVAELELHREIEELEARQMRALREFDYDVSGMDATKADIDEILATSNNVEVRRVTWEASQRPGALLKAGAADLRDRRNQVARSLGHRDYFAYRSSDYETTTGELLDLLDTFNSELRPLYAELHTWARYELAARYDQPVPEQLPIHWLTDVHGQDWTGVSLDGIPDYRDAMLQRSPESVLKDSEAFFVSMGFPSLPDHFWGRSSLYVPPSGAEYAKAPGSSAWHIDLDQDVRLLMSAESTPFWWQNTHSEMAHIYYFLSYSEPEVPFVLRDGANRSFHPAVSSLVGFAASRPSHLLAEGLIVEEQMPDEIAQLLTEALEYVAFVPFALGTVTAFEKEVYADQISVDQFNTRWWKLARDYQGIVAPETRSERWGDGLTKPHLTMAPGQYYDYGMATLLMFQMHEHLAVEVLGQSPHGAEYANRPEAGEFLKLVMSAGATKPWQDVVLQATGAPLRAGPMVRYFEPLEAWLQEQNRGRVHTLPPLPEN